jgi:DNA-binding protein YbaB
MSMFSKLNQIKEMRSQAKKMQNVLAGESARVEEKGIVMVMDGNQHITELSIPSEFMHLDKKKDLEKYLINTHEEAMKKIHKIMAEKIKTSGIKLPGM